MISDKLINPFDIDPCLELPHEIVDLPTWSEYCYFFAYDPAKNIGVSIHIGRRMDERGIVRGILYVFLPDGDILAHKCSGYLPHNARGFEAGAFRACCVEPFRLWTLEYDGILQRTQHEMLTSDVLRDHLDELVKFNIRLEAAAPLYSLEAHAPKGASWAHHHHEQIHSMRGEFLFRGERFELAGVGARDHSSGPRDYTPMIGAFWAQLLFPSGRAVHVMVVTRRGQEQTSGYITANVKRGYIFWGDGTPLEMIDVISHPEVAREDTPPRSLERDVLKDERLRKFTMILGTSRGQQVMEVERIRSVTSTYIPPNDEIAGTDLSRETSFQQSKTIMRVTWDGEVGHGMSDNFTPIALLRRD